jgi:hypothetical protein
LLSDSIRSIFLTFQAPLHTASRRMPTRGFHNPSNFSAATTKHTAVPFHYGLAHSSSASSFSWLCYASLPQFCLRVSLRADSLMSLRQIFSSHHRGTFIYLVCVRGLNS